MARPTSLPQFSVAAHLCLFLRAHRPSLLPLFRPLQGALGARIWGSGRSLDGPGSSYNLCHCGLGPTPFMWTLVCSLENVDKRGWDTVTDVWSLPPLGRAALPLTDGHPFRKSPLIMKFQIWAATWEGSTFIRRPRHTARPRQASFRASSRGPRPRRERTPCIFLVTAFICGPPGESLTGEGLLRDPPSPVTAPPPPAALHPRLVISA